MAAGDLADVEKALKVSYDKEIKDLMPGECVIQENTEFSRKEFSAVGRSFQFPVLVKNEWGLTLLGTTGAASNLNDAVNGKLEEATVKPYESWMRGRLTFAAASRGSEAGRKAFVKLSTFKMQKLMEQHRRVTEIQLLHGCEGIATVKSLNGQVITLQARSSSPAILSLLDGAIIDVYQSNGTSLRQGDLSVDSVDVSPTNGEYTITVTGTTTNITNNDIVFLNGATSSLTGAEMPGMGKLISVASGDVWGVSTNYSLWKGNTDTSFGLATAAKILKSHVKNVNRGGSGEYWLIMAPDVYQSLANDESAKQMFDSSYSENKLKGGTKSLELYTTSGQKLVLIGHPYQKEGKFYLAEKSNILRLGSSDHTMDIDGQELVRWVTGTNYADFASFTDQCLVLQAPAHNFAASGVTVS